MKKRGLSQEGLKAIACLTMLIDHIGLIFLPGYGLRSIGRLSFPIYCFLISEGAEHTRDSKKYALRLLLAAVIAELPYDLAFYGCWTLTKRSVMPTLLCGFLAICVLKKNGNILMKWLCVGVLALLAEKSRADYGMEGVALIVMFYLTRNLPCKWLIQAAAMLVLFAGMSSPVLFRLGPVQLERQMLGALSAIPLALYSGEKRTNSRAAQWGFYLFYPVHLAALYLARVLL